MRLDYKKNEHKALFLKRNQISLIRAVLRLILIFSLLFTGAVIFSTVRLLEWPLFGKNNKIYHYCSLGEIPQDKKFTNERTFLKIGNNNTIREFCTFNSGTLGGGGITEIGSNNWLMAYVHIAHDCKLGNEIVLANNSSLAGHVEIDDFATLGGFTLVHQFCKIGKHVITAVGTVTFKDIPPYVMAAGYNAKPNGINIEGLKRREFSTKCISNIKKGYKAIYREGNTLEEAKKTLSNLAKNSNEIDLYIDFITKSNRGLIR